jgi:hypothetical protein
MITHPELSLEENRPGIQFQVETANFLNEVPESPVVSLNAGVQQSS